MNAVPGITTSIDAPIEGWNAFNAKEDMPQTAAIVLDNIIPGAGKCDTRLGTFDYADLGTGLPVETVVSLVSPSQSIQIAASNGGWWSISDASTPVVTQIFPASTFTNNRWQNSKFTKADEDSVVILSNGVDETQVYDGTIMQSLSLVGSDPTLTSEFIGSCVFKGRVYYWKDNDNAFYYSQAGSYQGELSRFPLGAFVRRGGKLVMVTTWTQSDSGDSADDLIVFCFSTGEVLIYQGDDPDSAGYFEMVGRYITAEPLSHRGTEQFGTDTILMTKDGYVALSTVLQQGRTSDVPAFSRLIYSAVTERTADYSDLYGWECKLFPKKGLFIFNVPLSEATFEQHVLNTVTQRWCRFTGINVITMNVHKERLFGGTPDGKVMALLEGTSDNGSAINFTCLYAYQHMGDPGVQKGLTAAQILSTHPNPSLIDLRGYADYDDPVLNPLQIPTQTTVATWSINPASPAQALGSYWDEDDWGVNERAKTTKGWQNVSAYGFGVSLLVRFALVNESVIWRSTGLSYYIGGAQ